MNKKSLFLCALLVFGQCSGLLAAEYTQATLPEGTADYCIRVGVLNTYPTLTKYYIETNVIASIYSAPLMPTHSVTKNTTSIVATSKTTGGSKTFLPTEDLYFIPTSAPEIVDGVNVFFNKFSSFGWKSASAPSNNIIFKFSAVASVDLCFCLQYDSVNNSYVEVVIGGWSNTQSAVRNYVSSASVTSDQKLFPVISPLKVIPDTVNPVVYTVTIAPVDSINSLLTVTAKTIAGVENTLFSVQLAYLKQTFSAYSFRTGSRSFAVGAISLTPIASKSTTSTTAPVSTDPTTALVSTASTPVPVSAVSTTTSSASTFNSAGARSAIDAFGVLLTSLSDSGALVKAARANVVTLQASVDAVNNSEYKANPLVVAALDPAKTSLSQLSAKLLLIPAQKTLDDLNVAYNLYVTAIGAQPFIDGLNAAKTKVDTSLSTVQSQIDDAVSALKAAQEFFRVAVPGTTLPAFLTPA